MHKPVLLIFFLLISTTAMANEKQTTVIDSLLAKDSYALSLWKPRGLIPSPPDVINELNSTTKKFLNELKQVQLSGQNKKQKLKSVTTLVDALPWENFDTEEKEFLADVLAPAIKSIGLNPWSIF